MTKQVFATLIFIYDVIFPKKARSPPLYLSFSLKSGRRAKVLKPGDAPAFLREEEK